MKPKDKITIEGEDVEFSYMCGISYDEFEKA